MHHHWAVLDDNAKVYIRVTGFGGAYIIAPFLMLVILILLQLLIDLPPCLLLFISMRLRSTVIMRSICVKRSMLALPHQFFFSFAGGIRIAATAIYKHLTHLHSEKWSIPYWVMMDWLRCSLPCIGLFLALPNKKNCKAHFFHFDLPS